MRKAPNDPAVPRRAAKKIGLANLSPERRRKIALLGAIKRWTGRPAVTVPHSHKDELMQHLYRELGLEGSASLRAIAQK
jgi:hypothetical protein